MLFYTYPVVTGILIVKTILFAVLRYRSVESDDNSNNLTLFNLTHQVLDCLTDQDCNIANRIPTYLLPNNMEIIYDETQ